MQISSCLVNARLLEPVILKNFLAKKPQRESLRTSDDGGRVVENSLTSLFMEDQNKIFELCGKLKALKKYILRILTKSIRREV